MNNRIWELEEQCWESRKYGPDWFNSKKFAELIVRECAEVGSQWADGLIDTKHYAFVNKKIKQHFGVEE